MKICGIICEYNPFHNGHAYLIREARKSGYDTVVAIMSGNLVQRGETAICDKSSRAKAALYGGADIVVEIPSVFSMSRAADFAAAGVYIAARLGCEALIFGSESGDTDKLKKISVNLLSGSLDKKIKKYLSDGMAYSTARQSAYEDTYGHCPELKDPNDILAIEYITAINRSGCGILPVAVKRYGAEHDSSGHTDGFASASLIRGMIYEKGVNSVSAFMPAESAFILKECEMKGHISDIRNIENSILAKIRTVSAADLKKVPDVNDGLDFRIYNASRKASSLGELFELIKTKRYAMSRIKRVILSVYFGIDGSFVGDMPHYVRVLGMNGNGESLVRSAKSDGIPIVLRASELKGDPMFDLECKITDLYVLSYKKPVMCGSELTAQIVKIK